MIFKTTGALLILISSCLMGRIIVNESAKRLKELNTIKLFFVKMKEYASSGASNISDCIEDSAKTFEFKTKEKFVCFSKKIKNNRYTDFAEAWKDTQVNMEPLANSDEAIFGNFAKLIDGQDINSFITAIDSTIQSVTDVTDSLVNDERKNKKLYYSLCICAGIFTVILLI